MHKFGHSDGKAVIIDAVVAMWRARPENIRSMVVVLVERNKGMNGMDSSGTVISHNLRVREFGSKGPLRARNCRTERTCEDRRSRMLFSWMLRILRPYLYIRAHSSVVGSLSKAFQIE